MPTNSNFNPQGSNTPVAGGYAQPSPGVTEQIETLADPQGNAYATTLAANGVANLQTANFRDGQVTVQTTATKLTATAGQVVATITPGTAGIWEVYGYVTVTGTTVAATDTNNMALNQTGAAKLSPIMYTVTGTTGMTTPQAIPPTLLNLSAVDTVNVTAIANATSSSVYQVTLVARRVG